MWKVTDLDQKKKKNPDRRFRYMFKAQWTKLRLDDSTLSGLQGYAENLADGPHNSHRLPLSGAAPTGTSCLIWGDLIWAEVSGRHSEVQLLLWTVVWAQEWQLLLFPVARVPFAITGASVSVPVLALQEQGTSQAKYLHISLRKPFC